MFLALLLQLLGTDKGLGVDPNGLRSEHAQMDRISAVRSVCRLRHRSERLPAGRLRC